MRNNFRLMLLSMATFGLFGCSDNLTDSGSLGQDPDNGTDGFVAFKIATLADGTTRADDDGSTKREGSETTEGNYAAGDDNEYAITEDGGANVAFFFDNNGGYLNKSYLQVMADNSTSADHEEEKVFSAHIRKTKSGSDMQCVLVLNADPDALEDLATELSIATNPNALTTIMTKIDEEGLGKYGDYFTMTNTVYIDETNSADTVCGPVLITPAMIYDTWEEAQKSENKIKVHMERVVAKFSISYTNNSNSIFTENYTNTIVYTNDPNSTEDNPLMIRTKNDKGEFSDVESTWGIRIKGWGVNGTEKQTYLVKNLYDGSNFQNGYTFRSANLTTTAFGKWGLTYGSGNFGWNDQSRLRSYWAVDPHYNTDAATAYPQQYRDADNETVVAGHGSEKHSLNSTNVLDYIAYSDLSNTDYKYSPENTFGEYSWYDKPEVALAATATHQFENENYIRVGTHVLVAAELLIGENELSSETPSDKYCYGGVYWTQDIADKTVENDGETNTIANGALIEYMVSQLLSYYGSPLYYTEDVSASGLPVYEQFTASKANEYFELVAATVKGGDGCLMLAIKEGKELYKAAKGENSKGDEKDAYDNAKGALQDAIYDVGIVKHFKAGAMYYAVPIEHMVAKNSTAQPTKWSIGSYGVVRNHWYKVNVSAIRKPGTPVDDPYQPIIPNEDPEESGYAAFEIVIIPWHVINQDVAF